MNYTKYIEKELKENEKYLESYIAKNAIIHIDDLKCVFIENRGMFLLDHNVLLPIPEFIAGYDMLEEFDAKIIINLINALTGNGIQEETLGDLLEQLINFDTKYILRIDLEELPKVPYGNVSIVMGGFTNKLYIRGLNYPKDLMLDIDYELLKRIVKRCNRGFMAIDIMRLSCIIFEGLYKNNTTCDNITIAVKNILKILNGRLGLHETLVISEQLLGT